MVNRRFGRRRRRKCITCNCTCVDDYDSDFGSDYEDFIADLEARKESFRRLYEHQSLDEIELEMQKCDVMLDKLDNLPDDEIFESKNINFANITRQKLYALRDIKKFRLKDQPEIEPSTNITDTSKKTKKKKKNKKKLINSITGPCNGASTCDVVSNLQSPQYTTPRGSSAISSSPVKQVAKPSKADGKRPIKTRKLKVTVRGLPTDVGADELKIALKEKGFPCDKVIQFKKRTSVSDDPPMYRDLPIFLLILPDSSHHRLIYKLDEILNFDIVINRYRGGNQQIQCYKCQGFGHAQYCCNRQPRCMKCAGRHLSYQCVKDSTAPPKCCNCGLAHPANFIGCLERFKATHPEVPPMAWIKITTLINRLAELGFDTNFPGILETLLSPSDV